MVAVPTWSQTSGAHKVQAGTTIATDEMVVIDHSDRTNMVVVLKWVARQLCRRALTSEHMEGLLTNMEVEEDSKTSVQHDVKNTPEVVMTRDGTKEVAQTCASPTAAATMGVMAEERGMVESEEARTCLQGSRRGDEVACNCIIPWAVTNCIARRRQRYQAFPGATSSAAMARAEDLVYERYHRYQYFDNHSYAFVHVGQID